MATMKLDVVEGPFGQPTVGEVARGGRPRTRPGHRGRPVRSGTEHARGVEARARPAPIPTPRRTRSRPASRVARPGSRPGASPMSRAPLTLPRRRAGRNRAFGQRGGEPLGGLRHQGRVLGQRRSAHHHHHVLGGDQATGLGQHIGVDALGGGSAVDSAVGHHHRGGQTGGLAGPVAERCCGVRGERGGLGRQLDHGQVAVDHGGPQAQEEDGELLAQIAGQQHDECRP